MKSKKITGKQRALMVAAGLLLLVWLAYTQLYPIVEQTTGYQAQVFATKIINSAVQNELSHEEISYGDMVLLSRNAAGDVTSIESDMARINRLKTEVTAAIIEEIEAMGIKSLYLPVGSLIGGEITSGRGPLVELRVYPVGTVRTELYSQFASAGINQTLHQIMLNVQVEMRAVIPGYNIKADTSTDYCIAQTVIVGNIPDTYVDIGGDALIARMETPSSGGA